jgi:hypothetical protein
MNTEDVETIAHEVIDGKWGTGVTLRARLTSAGYDYATIQRTVNKILLEHSES